MKSPLHVAAGSVLLLVAALVLLHNVAPSRGSNRSAAEEWPVEVGMSYRALLSTDEKIGIDVLDLRGANWAKVGIKGVAEPCWLNLGQVILLQPASADVAQLLSFGAESEACTEAMARIDGAKQQWALENRKAGHDTPEWANLVGEVMYIRLMPVCPKGGFYTTGTVGNPPRCSIHGALYEE